MEQLLMNQHQMLVLIEQGQTNADKDPNRPNNFRFSDCLTEMIVKGFKEDDNSFREQALRYLSEKELIFICKTNKQLQQAFFQHHWSFQSVILQKQAGTGSFMFLENEPIILLPVLDQLNFELQCPQGHLQLPYPEYAYDLYSLITEPQKRITQKVVYSDVFCCLHPNQTDQFFGDVCQKAPLIVNRVLPSSYPGYSMLDGRLLDAAAYVYSARVQHQKREERKQQQRGKKKAPPKRKQKKVL